MLSRLPPTIPTTELRALIDTLQRFPRRARERGDSYAAQGRALVQDVQPDRFRGVVNGTAAYRTEWSHNGRGWVSRCSCPIGTVCKHAYALACALLGQANEEDGFDDPRLATLLPAEMLGQLVEEGNPLERLRHARLEWERQSALDELLVDAPVLGLNPYTPPLSLTLLEPDPDLLCWQLARTIAEQAHGWLPEALEPYRQRPDLAEDYLARERTALGAELLRWAERRPGDARRQLRLLFELVGRGDSWGLAFEVRVTTPRLADAPRTAVQLQQLRTELLRAPDLFPAPQQELLEWLADHATTAFGVEPYSPTRLTTAMPLSLLERVTESGVAVWADTLPAQVTARGGVAPGQPVRLSPQAARMVPDCIESDGDLRIELRLRWSEERVRALDDVILLTGQPGATRRSSLVLADGMFSPLADEPPPALRKRFQSVGSLPIPAKERGPFVASLAARFPHLRGTLAAHTRVRPAAPSVTIDLRSDDWLQVRVFAHSGAAAWHPGALPSDGAVLFEYTFERGWQRCTFDAAGQALPIAAATAPAATTPAGESAADGGQAVSDAELWIESPAFESVEPALRWLEFLPLGPGARLTDGPPAERARAVGWWMRASRRNMEILAAAWEKRPPEVAFFGSDQARRLLAGGRTATPRLRVAASGVDWLTVSAEWDAEGKRLSAADLAKLRAANTRFVRLESGWVAADSADEHDEIGRALADLGINPDGNEQRLTVWQLAGASDTTLQTLERMGGDRETLATLARVREQVAQFAGIPNVPLPAGLTADLRPYQRQGLDFLANASQLGLGAVLADDMGLGKTVQALAWLLHLREREPGAAPALVVCPASVVHNWAREAARFAPGLRVLLLTGGKLRHALRDEIPQHDLLVTTYALLRRDIEAWREAPLHAAILDEAQFIKNPDAAVTRAARSLNAKYRLALTGTPLENRALDLWSILSFATPGYLGGRAEFGANYDSADAPPHARLLLAAKLRPLLLRRTKQAVAPELPPRIEERVDCELSKGQRQLYVAELQRSRQMLAQVAREPGGLDGNKLSILSALTRLRQICCHPVLGGGRPGIDSGKFEALFEMLEPLLAEGHKVLVFSQFVQCLKLLATEMRGRGIAFHTLTGATTKRDRVVSAFQEDERPCVFLISLKAGGTGLNLTSASYVVLFDPWWNPAVEAQAIDRTHRIGQERTVIAYRMLARGTIEEKIWELQQRKAALVREVLGEGSFARTLTRDDLEYLFADVG